MRHFLAKRWFLLLFIGVIGAAWRFPNQLHPQTRLFPLLLIVASALFLVAWSLDSANLLRAVTRPAPALWAILISYGAVPAMGWLAAQLMSSPDLRIGVMISTSVPCTMASAVLWTRMAKGNEGTALLVTMLSTSSSWLLTTAWLAWTTRTQVVIEPFRMMGELFLVLVVPVAGGQLLRAVPACAHAATRWQREIGVVSRLLILLVILKAAVDFRTKLDNHLGDAGAWIVLSGVVCVSIHLTALLGGLWTSRGLRFDRPTQIAVAFSCSQKTLPVALYLFETHFANLPLAVVPLVFYHGGQLIVDTFIADYWVGTPVKDTVIPSQPAV
jgi:sodium/bile acid cotransporter 7